jgi:ribonuclease P protein component
VNGIRRKLSHSTSEFRFPRSARLLKHADFERVYKQGQRHFGRLMTVFFLTREAGTGARIGFTVSRAFGGAVERNRLRRRLREAARRHRAALYGDVDVVVNPKRSAVQVNFDELSREMGRAFQWLSHHLPGGQRGSEDIP